MIVARTALWILFATGSVAGVLWVSRASWEEMGAPLRRLRDAPTAIRESSRFTYATGAGIGAAAAALILSGGGTELLTEDFGVSIR